MYDNIKDKLSTDKGKAITFVSVLGIVLMLVVGMTVTGIITPENESSAYKVTKVPTEDGGTALVKYDTSSGEPTAVSTDDSELGDDLDLWGSTKISDSHIGVDWAALPDNGNITFGDDLDIQVYYDSSNNKLVSTGDWDFNGNALKNIGSVDTEQVSSIKYISSDDDIVSKIEGADEFDVFQLETDAVFTITSTLDIPSTIIIFGNGATITKGFNGTLATSGDRVNVFDLSFDGNKNSGYTGDGVEDRTGDASNYASHFKRCYFINNAGDGRILNDNCRHRYEDCRFNNNDGWGIVLNNPAGEHPRQNDYLRNNIASNGAGGVQYNGDSWNEYWRSRIQLCGGPAMEFNSGTHQRIELDNMITGNDGPAYLLDGGQSYRSWMTIKGRQIDNCGNPDSALSTPVGEIHIESSTISPKILLQSGRTGDGASGSSVSNQGSYRLNLNIQSAMTDGSLDGSIDRFDTFQASPDISFTAEYIGQTISDGETITAFSVSASDGKAIIVAGNPYTGSNDCDVVRGTPDAGEIGLYKTYNSTDDTIDVKVEQNSVGGSSYVSATVLIIDYNQYVGSDV